MGPPRGFTNPAPKTESAREAVKSFYCELCSKGYSRMPDFEAHESSYDHQHKKRLKEMKQMQRDPSASDRARKAERKADEKSGLITMKPIKIGGAAKPGGGFKKGGFRSAFGGTEVKMEEPKAASTGVTDNKTDAKADVGGVESETDDEYEYYDPKKPTDCWEGCTGRHI